MLFFDFSGTFEYYRWMSENTVGVINLPTKLKDWDLHKLDHMRSTVYEI